MSKFRFRGKARRIREERPDRIPLRAIVPNLITSMAACAGITSISLSSEGRFLPALWALLVAVVCDGMDGRIARLLNASSKLGAELDSLADFVNFGVAPAMFVYFMFTGGPSHMIDGVKVSPSLTRVVLGCALYYAMCDCFRLARFNTMLEQETAPYWKHFFTGVPAPGGCWMVLTPAIISLALGPKWTPSPYLGIFMLLFVGSLMASRLPTISLKHLHVSKRYLPFVLAGLLLLVAFLVSNFWLTIGILGIGYLLTVPLTGILFLKTKAKYVVAVLAMLCAMPIFAKDYFSVSLWRGETMHMRLHDSCELGTEALPAGLTLRTGRLRPIKFRQEFNRMLYHEVADRVEWDVTGAGPVIAEITATEDMQPGTYKTGKLSITVVDRVLPPPAKWEYVLDLWQHPWAIARYNKVKPFSNAFYDKARPIYTELAKAGQKFLTLTLLDEPWNHQCYDAYHSMIRRVKLDNGKWQFDYQLFDEFVEFGRSCGIGPYLACYTMCPWENVVRWQDERGETHAVKAPPGSKEFEDFWGDFLVDFAKHLKAKGWLKDCFIAMDERSPAEVKTIADFIRSRVPGMKISMAGNCNPNEFEGIVIENYCQILNHVNEKFLAEVATRKQQGYITTHYVCCAPAAPNTFMMSFPEEAFWLGYYPATKGMDGFLRWAWNSWGEDPLVDASFGDWRAGDTFLIYPDGSLSWRFLMLRGGIVAAEKSRILRAEGLFKEEFAELDKAYDYDSAAKKLSTIQPLNDKVRKLVNSVK